MKGAQCGIGIYFSERNPVGIEEVSEKLHVETPTNNVAELTAIKRAIDILIEKQLIYYNIKIYTDSQYSIDCVEKWYDMWIEKNNFNKRNIELIRDIYDKKKMIGFEFISSLLFVCRKNVPSVVKVKILANSMFVYEHLVIHRWYIFPSLIVSTKKSPEFSNQV